MKPLFLFVLIIGLQTVYAQNSCLQAVSGVSSSAAKLDISLKLNKKPNELIDITIRDPEHPHFFASANVVKYDGKNLLQFNFYLRTENGQRSPILNGKESIRLIMKEIEKHGIQVDMFMSDWSDNFKFSGMKPSDNMMDFMRGYKENLNKSSEILKKPLRPYEYINMDDLNAIEKSVVEAAWSTWTGKQMRDLGFHHIDMIRIYEDLQKVGGDGKRGSVEIQVFWSKVPGKHPGYLYTINSNSDDSAIPRLHQLVHHFIK